MCSQDWYERRGYRLIKTVANFYRPPGRGSGLPDARTVFMKRDLSLHSSQSAKGAMNAERSVHVEEVGVSTLPSQAVKA